MPEPLTITQAVREAFAQAGAGGDATKVLVAARTILKNSGNVRDDVKRHNVSQVRVQLKKLLGKEFTAQQVRGLIDGLPSPAPPRKANAETARPSPTSVHKPVTNGSVAVPVGVSSAARTVVETVRAVKTLIRLCGGVAAAREVLDLIGEDKS